jgi:hypothetical protein
MPPPAPPVFKSWLLFFPPSMLLGHMATVLAVKYFVPEAADDAGAVLTGWVVSLVAPMPVSLVLFGWLVTPYFEPDPDPLRARLPVLRPWLVYYAVSTVLGFVTSVLGGALLGAIVLGARQKIDFENWFLLLFVAVFLLAPPSWITFRWVVGRYYLAGAGEQSGNDNSPG